MTKKKISKRLNEKEYVQIKRLVSEYEFGPVQASKISSRSLTLIAAIKKSSSWSDYKKTRDARIRRSNLSKRDKVVKSNKTNNHLIDEAEFKKIKNLLKEIDLPSKYKSIGKIVNRHENTIRLIDKNSTFEAYRQYQIDSRKKYSNSKVNQLDKSNESKAKQEVKRPKYIPEAKDPWLEALQFQARSSHRIAAAMERIASQVEKKKRLF